MSDRNYPIEVPQGETDDRFTFGLALDVIDVLKQHGYPDATGVDVVELQQVLWRFLYR